MFLAVQDLFDNPLFTRLGAIANPSIMWTSMAGKRSRFGMLEARGSNRPLNVFSTDSLRRVWAAGIAQVGVHAAGSHEFEPGLVKGAVNSFPNQVDRDGTPVPLDRELFHILPHLVEDQFTQMLDRLDKQILPGWKVVELSAAR